MGYRATGIFELAKSFARAADLTRKAEARAVNRVSTTIIAAQSRAVVERIGLTVGRVKQAVAVTRKATADEPRIVITVTRRGVGLIQFQGRWNGPKSEGASAVVIRAEGRHTYAGTFIAKGLGGNKQIFERKGPKVRATKGRYVGELRQKLKTQYGPSVFSQFKREDIQKVGIDTWTKRLPIELDRESRYALKQAGLL